MRNLYDIYAVSMAIYNELMNNVVVANLYAETPPPPSRKEVLANWLNEMGVKEKSIEDYEPNEEMVAMSLSELETLKREFDILKVRADEGEELARKVRALHEEFFPTDNE